MSNFGTFSYFETSLSLGVEQGLQKPPKFDINDLRLLFHCNILIPRGCPRKTPFKTQWGGADYAQHKLKLVPTKIFFTFRRPWLAYWRATIELFFNGLFTAFKIIKIPAPKIYVKTCFYYSKKPKRIIIFRQTKARSKVNLEYSALFLSLNVLWQNIIYFMLSRIYNRKTDLSLEELNQILWSCIKFFENLIKFFEKRDFLSKCNICKISNIHAYIKVLLPCY